MLTLFSWIYDLCIAPLAIAYGAAYYVCSRALGYGYGLLALSALTTLLLEPLRRKVAHTQDEERRLRAVLDPQLARIKAEASGEERHQRVRRLYRRYGYHPIMSIRAMWGLLLQVPFILAAYHMLSELSALRLVSFWGIASLAQPDGLLGGVNLLPILMTLFNLAAALLTPGATRRETLQAVFIAVLFLVLLYGAPSALLVYWTANNFLSLVSVLLQRYRPAKRAEEADMVDIVSAGDAAAGPESPEERASPLWPALYAFACVSLPVIWGFLLRWRVDEMHSGERPFYFTFSWLDLVLAGALAVAAAAEAWRIKARREAGRRAGWWRYALVALCLGAALFIVLGWAVPLRGRSVSGKIFIWSTLGSVAAAALAWFTAGGGLNLALGRLLRREADRSGRLLYWPAALAIAALVALFAPLASFQSAPEVFSLASGEALRRLLPYFLCLVYAFLYLRVVLPRRAGALVGLLLAYFALAGLVFALAFPPFGIIDGDAFQPDAVAGRWTAVVQDVVGLAAALGLLFLLARLNAMRYAAFGLGVCAFALAAYGIVAVASTPAKAGRNGAAAHAAENRAAGLEANLPPYHHRLFSLSPDRPNVLVFMFDMFFGGDMQRMLDDDPGMAGRLPGFVWYRDTLSDGSNTLTSFPAILGGPDYTPLGINAQPHGTLADKVVASTAVMPGLFAGAGYDVSCYNVRANLAVHHDKTLADLVGHSADRLLDVFPPGVYAELARAALNPDGGAANNDQVQYLLAIALFRGVPNLVRDGLVDLGIFDSDSIVEKLYGDAAIPLLMPRFVTADSAAPTFKFFASTMSHNPYLLGPDSLVPLQKRERLAVVRSGDAHYFTDRHIMRLMEKIVARLRELGVYDNTRILLASDHDNKNDPHPYMEGKGSLFMYEPKPYALLMAKDFGADGPLEISDRPMQGHDVPGLAFHGLGQGSDTPAPPPDDPGRVREHTVGRPNILHHSEKSFINLTTFRVVGSMFDPDNWSVAE